jgi:hypothetical protein
MSAPAAAAVDFEFGATLDTARYPKLVANAALAAAVADGVRPMQALVFRSKNAIPAMTCTVVHEGRRYVLRVLRSRV